MTFKPGDVVLTLPCPLTGCFGKTEREQAAFMIVRALAVHGNEWRTISNQEVFDTFKKDVVDNVSPAVDVCRNPFFRPDAPGLEEHGFILRTGTNGPNMTNEFTDKGIERLSKWVRKEDR